MTWLESVRSEWRGLVAIAMAGLAGWIGNAYVADQLMAPDRVEAVADSLRDHLAYEDRVANIRYDLDLIASAICQDSSVSVLVHRNCIIYMNRLERRR